MEAHDVNDPAACWCHPFQWSDTWIHQDPQVPEGVGYPLRADGQVGSLEAGDMPAKHRTVVHGSTDDQTRRAEVGRQARAEVERRRLAEEWCAAEAAHRESLAAAELRLRRFADGGTFQRMLDPGYEPPSKSDIALVMHEYDRMKDALEVDFP